MQLFESIIPVILRYQPPLSEIKGLLNILSRIILIFIERKRLQIFRRREVYSATQRFNKSAIAKKF